MATSDDYAWIHDSHLSEGACVTVVPAADRAAVLAAYGAREGTGVPFEQAEAAGLDPFESHTIQVVELPDALLVVEEFGYEGMRLEVLGPLSRASRVGVAASYVWNVNHDTTFSTARAGAVESQLDLYAVEPGDDELDDLPANLRALALAGGAEEGDPIAAGLAMVTTHTAADFTEAVLRTATVYEIQPTPDALTTVRPPSTDRYDPLDSVPGASATVAALPAATQRALAEWATRAAVHEGGMAGDPVVREVLGGFGSGRPAAAPTGLDPLARTTAQEHERFRTIEDDHGGGWHGSERRSHPYYEATVPGDFGPSTAVSHLEGCYLAQRRSAVEAVRQAANPDPFSAAVSCLVHALAAFRDGRTTRGWTFEETAEGRWRGETEPGPRHQQFVRVLASLLSDLGAGATGPDVWVRASAGLPRPLTDRERVEAIHADALAAARGEFATYQVSRVEDFGDPEDPDDAGDDWGPDEGVVLTFGEIHSDVDPADLAGLDSTTWAGELAFLTTEVARLDAFLGVLERPEAALAVISAAPSALESVEPLAARFGIGEHLARVLLGTRLRPVLADDLRRIRHERAMLADHLDRVRRG